MCVGLSKDISDDIQYTNTCCDLDTLNGAAFSGVVGDIIPTGERFIDTYEIWNDAYESDTVLVVYSLNIPVYATVRTYTFTVDVTSVLNDGLELQLDAVPNATADTLDDFATLVESNNVFYDINSTDSIILDNAFIPSGISPIKSFSYDITSYIRYLNELGHAGKYGGVRITPQYESNIQSRNANPTIGYALSNIEIIVTEPDDQPGISTGALIGIIIGTVAVFSILLTIAYLSYTKKITNRPHIPSFSNTIPPTRQGTYFI
ncbi:hypothetical protein EQVG_00304 [Emiliania huxleyi virus 207]|nr:hypothetical protein EQVG_00304 [Emiliania huxleyi virus 207]